MPYKWDSYTRNLVRGWSRLGMTAAQIHDAWPWSNRPTVSEVLRLQLHLSTTGNDDAEKPLTRS